MLYVIKFNRLRQKNIRYLPGQTTVKFQLWNLFRSVVTVKVLILNVTSSFFGHSYPSCNLFNCSGCGRIIVAFVCVTVGIIKKYLWLLENAFLLVFSSVQSISKFLYFLIFFICIVICSTLQIFLHFTGHHIFYYYSLFYHSIDLCNPILVLKHKLNYVPQ